MTYRLWAVPGLLLLLSACSDVGPAARPVGGLRGESCGIIAAYDYRKSPSFRENPPACDLPEPEELTLSCAIHDQVRDPDYSPEYDEEGQILNYVPPPEYRLSTVRCEFSNPERNRARCTFAIATPGSEKPIPSSATLRHQYWRDDGPAHHFEGTRWYLDDSCVADKRRSPAG